VQEFCPGPQDRRARGLPAGVPLALFVGGIRTSLRNLDSVLTALTRVPGLHLAIAGDSKRSPYPAMAAALGVADRAHFLGFRNDVADLMRSADFFVYPSRYEACSLVLLEAMSSGLPIITAVTAGGSELLNESCGWVLPNPNDVDALANRMCQLTDDVPLRRRLSEGSRATALPHTWSQMADKYIELFREPAAVTCSVTADLAPAMA
jgi:glycosyltransferase involved in cell wall biosynthesis